MENTQALKLKIGDVIYINRKEYWGIKGMRKYVVSRITQNRLGGYIYVIKSTRKNAVKEEYIYASDVNDDLAIPTTENLYDYVKLFELNQAQIILFNEDIEKEYRKAQKYWKKEGIKLG